MVIIIILSMKLVTQHSLDMMGRGEGEGEGGRGIGHAALIRYDGKLTSEAWFLNQSTVENVRCI